VFCVSLLLDSLFNGLPWWLINVEESDEERFFPSDLIFVSDAIV
jgi:hypothetical protein